MDLQGNSYYREVISEMVEYMSGMVRYSENKRKTLTYWAVVTHAHHLLNKFPILRLTSTTHTGKTNATKFVADISRAPSKLGGLIGSQLNFKEIKGSTPISVRTLVALSNKTKGTCCFDEADNFPLKYYESIFDKDGSQTFKMEKDGGNYSLDKTINLWAPVMMNGRTFLEDESNQNRTIEIGAFSDMEWARDCGHEYRLGHFVHYRELLRQIAEEIDWEAVSEGTGTRASQCWAPLKAVARHLGDEEFLGYIESQIEEAHKDSIDGRADEIDYKVIESMITLCWREVESNKEFPHRLKVKDIATEVSETSRAVTKTLKVLKVKTSKSGVMWAAGLNPEKLSKLCERAGVRTDEWLQSQMRTVGFLD